MSQTREAQLHDLLRRRGDRVACAESLTGGELAARLSGPGGSSAVFLGGVVCYATEVKRELLGVTAERVVSAACAEQLAAGVRELLHAEWAVATTGVAGPDRQEGQPVGTVFVGLAGPDGVESRELHLEDEGRPAIRSSACEHALAALVDLVSR